MHKKEIALPFSEQHQLCVRLMFPWGCPGLSPPSLLTTGAPGQRLHYLNHHRTLLPPGWCLAQWGINWITACDPPTHSVLLTLEGCLSKFFIALVKMFAYKMKVTIFCVKVTDRLLCRCVNCVRIYFYTNSLRRNTRMNVKCRYNEAMLVDESCSGLYDLQTRDGKGGGWGGDVRGGGCSWRWDWRQTSVWSNKKGPTERVGFYGH